MKRHVTLPVLFLVLLVSCSLKRGDSIATLNEATIRKYQDTSINVYDKFAVVKLPIQSGIRVWNPGYLTKGPEDRIFVANLTGEIYSIVDSDQDGLEDQAVEFCNVKNDGFRTPTGLAFNGWDLYVGLPQQIRIYRDLDHDFIADTSLVFFDKIPFSDHPYEYTTGLKFDENGWLHFALTTDSWNAGASPDPLKYRGSILKVSPDGATATVMAKGVRSVFGMDFDQDGQLFFVDNQGWQNQFEELHILRENQFYGYNTAKFGELEVTQPLAQLTYEVAPAELQCVSEDGEEYLYLANYGPGEYWSRGGVSKIRVEKFSADSIITEEIPVADIPKSAGLLYADNGDIYVSSVGKTDYWYFALDSTDGAIYRMIRQPWIEPAAKNLSRNRSLVLDEDKIEKGKFLFAERACSSCHSIDGKSVMLGPDLKNIASVYSRMEILEEIKEPSKRLKPGDFPTRIVTTDNEVFLGRVISSSEKEVQLILIGNLIKKIPSSQIKSTEKLTKSLMYPGLLGGLDDEDINALLDYIVSLKG